MSVPAKNNPSCPVAGSTFARRTSASLLGALALFSPVALAAIELYVEPDCPSPSDDVTLVAYESALPRLKPQPVGTSRAGNTLHVVGALTYDVVQPPPPAQPLAVPVGRLAVGDYVFEFATQLEDATGLGPEVAQGAKAFRVSADPPPCSPARLSVAQGTSQVALPGVPYPLPIVVSARDARGRGVPDLDLFVTRMSPPVLYETGEIFGVTVALSKTRLLTGADGSAAFTAIAGPDAGAVAYMISWRRGPKWLSAFVNFGITRTPFGSAVPVVEYMEKQAGTYFVTADLAEQRDLDEGRTPGWTRTGGTWLAFAVAEPTAQPPRMPVCRFFGEAWHLAHFFSAFDTECAALRQDATWLEESSNVFAMVLPTAQGCPEGTAPVYRTVRFAAPAGHRYTESAAVAVRAFAYGATIEGLGGFPPVAMCGPR